MIASIKEFFTQLIDPGTRQTEADRGKALQIATAALLLEMMRMDERIAVEERNSIVATLRRQFSLDSGQLATLLDLAEQEARQATGYYQFTSLINKNCTADQKIRIIENMWQVAMADGHLDAHELHLMRKIADLLYVGHADYVAAKQRARLTTALPAAIGQ
ncbi:MAG: TerB family tellurite resistance protein [Propionivibrio sp.]|uniref:tellurite resistance TerB family protein n=1 Tax=Propionivibrio sp. TaxID=2212460 RepID=UPI001A5A4D94|nr:TerB family tellurite resistance protein [Propionivibrio sp.]MBL8414967.1 TerB family tellurite resistance protein [Propionivibrio sp.]